MLSQRESPYSFFAILAVNLSVWTGGEMFAQLSTEVGREASVGAGENKKWTLAKMLLFLLVLARPSAPSLVQLILILPIRPSTIMLVPSRCPAKLVWHTWQVSFVD